MLAVVQRVKRARVTVDGRTTGEIGAGLLVLLGVAAGDGPADADYLAAKLAQLRIFPDEAGKLNRSLLEAGGALLAVSQFTLLGDCRKGRRPSFSRAAPPEQANELYQAFIQACRAAGAPVATGEFGALMDVELVNWGPVTLIVASPAEAD